MTLTARKLLSVHSGGTRDYLRTFAIVLITFRYVDRQLIKSSSGWGPSMFHSESLRILQASLGFPKSCPRRFAGRLFQKIVCSKEARYPTHILYADNFQIPSSLFLLLCLRLSHGLGISRREQRLFATFTTSRASVSVILRALPPATTPRSPSPTATEIRFRFAHNTNNGLSYPVPDTKVPADRESRVV